MANEVSKMQAELKSAEGMRAQFNSREALFGHEVPDQISPASPLHLPCISTVSPLYLPCISRSSVKRCPDQISPVAPLHLHCISPVAPLYLALFGHEVTDLVRGSP